MGQITSSIDISASAGAVFDLITDLNRLPQWSTITVDTHDTPRQPIEQGDTFTQTLRVLGQSIETEWRVTELERPRQLAYETTAPGGGRMTMKQSISDTAGGSIVAFEVDYDLPEDLAAALESDLAERRNERELEHSLQNLKDLAEAASAR
jgi:uncharacterized membrane protein